jgi:RNase H-like domain found in reverse transcriptase
MDINKVKTILDWPEPRKFKDIQSFLGFANFYRHFIFNFSDLTVPLTRLTRKGTPWVFSESCRTSFEALKEAFTSAPVLAKWNPGAPLIVETDASDYALGAILSTIDPTDNQVHPIA